MNVVKLFSRERDPRRGVALRCAVALAGALAVAGAVAAAEKASPTAEQEEADAQRRFTKDLTDSINRTLSRKPPEQTPAVTSTEPSVTGKVSSTRAVDPTRIGMAGIRPTAPFPANCMPIMGLPNTGINPLLANVESGPVRVAVLGEVDGDSTPIGRNWRDGVELAAKIINSSGGLLGRSIETRLYDASGPGGGRRAASEALDNNPFAVVGPVTAGAATDAIDVIRRVQIPHFVGTRGIEAFRNENPFLFRTSTTTIEEVVQLGTYFRDQRKVRRVAIVSTQNDYGERLRQILTGGLRFSNISIVQDIRLKPGTTDFRNAALQVKDRNPELVAVLMPQSETAGFLRTARSQGLDQPVLVDGLTMGKRFLEEAGTAANGAIGLIGLHANAPVVRIREMAGEFEQTFGYRPSPVAVQGFIALNMMKALVDKACSFNGPDLIKASKGLKIDAKDQPGALMDFQIFQLGGINEVMRDNFLFEVRNQQLSIVANLPLASLPF